MSAQAHPLEPFFQQAVRNSYEGKLGLHDPDVTGYVAHLLCEFSDAQNLYKVRDPEGHPIEELDEMIRAADPVNGPATSFDEERAMRKHIGDYALFVGGMYPESGDPTQRRRRHQPSLEELIRAGILPGDPSLYPSSLDEVYGRGGPRSAPGPGAAESATQAG